MTESTDNPIGNRGHDADRAWMRRALELAARGTALTSPNPLVGAVVVKDGKAVGEGFHTHAGRKHAEVLALEQAGEAARGATLYLNLEPCCHTGRTGPCTESVIHAGVTRVVAAMSDPNPQVSGQGFELLKDAGIEVSVSDCAEEARRMNESFARFITSGVPLVTLKAAMTLDGKIAAPDDNSGWITSDAARAHVQQLRHAHDAIWAGIGTVLADDPLLTDRSGEPRRRPLLRVVMDSHLRIPLTAKMLSNVNDDLMILCAAAADPAKRRALEHRGVEVHVAPSADGASGQNARPELRVVLQELARRQMTSVMIEAGAALNGAALEAGIVDKIFFYYAPKLLGGYDALPVAGGRGIRAMRDALDVKHIVHHQFGDNFAIEGYLKDVYGNH
ncbi:MAG: bifunctional diaminohydroxyphosphoribosylaminopyrimidine deaminase/5-amino-6-(5-phosphoribosylamino)uracil reductase RibD [Acidobacteria bacterium]|nr:bifunctional diaminohydroxyphosphoribosylaminopyrimidine deaminase/5-amino-6-(5-phosphoribosylamino)uracil reductase RibD [Acidobacteriota bacterium]